MPNDRSLTSTPSIVPRSMWNASNALQRSCVAGNFSHDQVHGHGASQLQFSKYVPSNDQLMARPFR
jgi:hypothetical protein